MEIQLVPLDSIYKALMNAAQSHAMLSVLSVLAAAAGQVVSAPFPLVITEQPDCFQMRKHELKGRFFMFRDDPGCVRQPGSWAFCGSSAGEEEGAKFPTSSGMSSVSKRTSTVLAVLSTGCCNFCRVSQILKVPSVSKTEVGVLFLDVCCQSGDKLAKRMSCKCSGGGVNTPERRSTTIAITSLF